MDPALPARAEEATKARRAWGPSMTLGQTFTEDADNPLPVATSSTVFEASSVCMHRTPHKVRKQPQKLNILPSKILACCRTYLPVPSQSVCSAKSLTSGHKLPCRCDVLRLWKQLLGLKNPVNLEEEVL